MRPTADLLEARPERSPHVRVRPQDAGLSIFNTLTAEFYVLNCTGKIIWEACDGMTPIDKIIDRLASACSPSPDRDEVARDVAELVQLLRDKELVQMAVTTGKGERTNA